MIKPKHSTFQEACPRKKLHRGMLMLMVCGLSTYAHAETTCPPAQKEATPEMMETAMHNAQDHGFMWRISKNGHSSYLYGTIHAAKFGWMFPGPHVKQAMRATDTLAVELDIMDPDIQARTVKGMAAMHSVELPAPLLQRLQKQAETDCVPYATLAKLSPELQVEMLSLQEGQWEGLNAAFAIDGVLSAIWHAAKKEVVSLETPESQLKVLQMGSPQETISMVQDALDKMEMKQGRVFFKRIARIWQNSDYEEMSHFGDWCECLDTEVDRKMMKRALDQRNPRMADRIDALHVSGKQVFAAVGSLHMFGPLGLPTLMQQRGYRVERIDFR